MIKPLKYLYFVTVGFALFASSIFGMVSAQGDQALAGTEITVALRSLPETDFIISRLPEFEKQTGIKVRLAQYPEQQLRDKLVQDLSTGAGQFDIIAVDSIIIPEFAEAGWVAPLDELIPNATQDYDIADISAGARGLLSYKDSLYGLPIYTEVTQLMYRKDLFEEAGLTVPETMDELIEAARQLTDRSANRYGIALRGLRGFGMNVYTWAGFLHSYGGQFLSENTTPNINNKAGVEATQVYADLIREYGPPGQANFSWDNVQNAFTSGQAAMIIDANNFYTRIEDPSKSNIAGKIGYAVVPAGPNGRFPASYALGFAVSPVGAKTDGEKQAATEFILWATSYDMQLASIEKGIVSQTRDKVLTSNQYRSAANEEWLTSTAESLRIANPNYLPQTVAYRTMGDIVGVSVQEVISGQQDSQAALDQAAAQIEEYLKQIKLYDTPRTYQEP